MDYFISCNSTNISFALLSEIPYFSVLALVSCRHSVRELFLFCLQAFVFIRGKEWDVPSRLPYMIDLCPSTFELIDEVLNQISAGMEVRNEWPPTLERECITVTTLNILNLQVRAY